MTEEKEPVFMKHTVENGISKKTIRCELRVTGCELNYVTEHSHLQVSSPWDCGMMDLTALRVPCCGFRVIFGILSLLNTQPLTRNSQLPPNLNHTRSILENHSNVENF